MAYRWKRPFAGLGIVKNKADFSIKFVSYAMHGLKELEENTRQYCLAKNFSAKFIPYLKCFTGKDDYKACLTEAGVSESSLASCVNDTNKNSVSWINTTIKAPGFPAGFRNIRSMRI